MKPQNIPAFLVRPTGRHARWFDDRQAAEEFAARLVAPVFEVVSVEHVSRARAAEVPAGLIMHLRRVDVPDKEL